MYCYISDAQLVSITCERVVVLRPAVQQLAASQALSYVRLQVRVSRFRMQCERDGT